MKPLKKDQIENELTTEIKQLEAAIEKAKDKELEKNKEEIKRLLYQELLLKYGYRKDFYDYVAARYADVQRALQILTNTSEYQTILKKSKPMKKVFCIAVLFFSLFVFSQEETVHSIYFESDVHELKPYNLRQLWPF